jgi:YVTN family beta-propeller protein
MKAHPVVPAVLLFALAIPVHAGGSNSLMDVRPDGRLIVANPDNGTVSIVDTRQRTVLHEIKVGDKPEGVAWIGAGPVAAVAVYHDRSVVFIDTEAGKIVQSLEVAAEPYGIVTNKDGSRLWVTHDYPGLVSEIDTAGRKVLRTMPVGSFARGLALHPEESRLYVTEFYTGILRALDLKSGTVVDSWKGHSTDNLCRNVVLHPRRPKAYLSHIRSKIEVIDGSGSIFPQLSICDLVPPNDSKRRSSVAMDTFNDIRIVTNPWESALSPDGKRIYTIYAGTDDMNACNVVDDDYKEIERVRLMQVGSVPKAVRVSADGQTVYVYSSMDFAVGIYDAASLLRQATVKVCAPANTPEWVRGKVLFNSANQPMTGPRWIACASCHPDGLTDGRVWHNPEGLRKTPAFFGMAHTHPLHWSADRDEVQDFEYTIRGRLMKGRGLIAGAIKPKVGFHPIELEEQTAGKSKDLDALAIYSNSFEFTYLSPHAVGLGKLSESAQRGKELFFSKEVGCSTCHSGPYYTDSSLQKPFKLHDVGTGDDPREKIGPRYDTPTLLGAYRTAPYLHDGRAKTLHDVLTTANKQDRHGRTSQLKMEEVDDLVAFLKSLPYEYPPYETANTVKYRVPPRKEDK